MTQVIAVAKTGKNVLTATSPNDFVFHSSYNTFKIVASGTTQLNVAGAVLPSVSFAHNSPLGSTTSMMVFVKFPDGYVTPAAIANGVQPQSKDGSRFLAGTYWDNTNVTMTFGGGTYTCYAAWYVFEAAVT